LDLKFGRRPDLLTVYLDDPGPPEVIMDTQQTRLDTIVSILRTEVASGSSIGANGV
jgi:hypothetical protein